MRYYKLETVLVGLLIILILVFSIVGFPLLNKVQNPTQKNSLNDPRNVLGDSIIAANMVYTTDNSQFGSYYAT